MKKILSLFLLVFVISGCTTNYNVYFGEDAISEDINIVIDGDINRFKGLDTDTFYIEDELINYDNYVLNDNSLIYRKIINVENKKSYVVLSSQFKYEDLVNHYNINQCYDHVFVDNLKDYIFISLSDFKCELESPINLSVTSYYKISNTNGNKEKDNTYTWKLENNKNNDIEITIQKEKNNTSSTSIIESISIYNIIIFIILVITGIVVYILQKKNSK